MTKNSKNGLRAQILRAARKLLVKDGIQNVSMRKIAAEIGCKAPSIYYHFRNKDELVHTLIDEGFHRLHQHLLTAQEGLENPTPQKKIENFVRSYVQYGMENPEYFEIMYLTYSEEIVRFTKESLRTTHDTLELGATIYKEGADAGVVDQLDAHLAVTNVLYMLNGYVSMVLMHRVDPRFDQDLLQEDLINRSLRSMGLRGVGEEALATV